MRYATVMKVFVLSLMLCAIFGGHGGCGSGDGGEGGGAEEAMGCTPGNRRKICTDMFVACQDKGYPCTRDLGGKTLCAHCQDNCLKGDPYKFSDCYKCGFYDP